MSTLTTPPRAASLEEQVLEIVRELLRELGSHQAAESISLDSSFEGDLGLGSLERVELLVRLEGHFHTRLPDSLAQRAETPAEWVQALLEGEKEVPVESRYRILQPSRPAPPEPVDALSMVEVLRRHAELEPDRVHIHLLEESGGQDISYGQLLETASRVAAGLTNAGLRRDETVAIMLPTCSDFFYAFFGVMLAGGIPVPIYPPARPDKIEEYVTRQVGILRNAEVRFLISFEQARAVSKIMRLGIPSLVEVTHVDTLRRAPAGLQKAAIHPSETAFIQYTSGSTGDPKGVVLTHSNILANVRGIGWSVKVRPTDIVVTWLPLYHDMGLIGSWLFSFYYALPITVLSPLAFLSRPERWLRALSDSGGTLSPAPNFSFELCARKIPDSALEGLDLSPWRIAINAGEAVLPDTLARFEKRFKACGFRAESYVPCYGLAESSVALAFPPIDRRPVIDTIRRGLFEKEGRAEPAGPTETNRMRFVANGKPMPGHAVKIVDDEGRELGERIQGRLLLRGPSRTSGYYRNPEATARVLTRDGWMDSGDLAYWAGGELYITGRRKDSIIKAGRNINPQDVEEATAEVEGVRRGCVAAFGTADTVTGTERLVVAAETRATAPDELRRIEIEILKHVDAILGIPPDKVTLVAPHSIPKTSSGKIRRNETRNLYEAGKLRANKRAAWAQIVRLWVRNLDSWIGLGLRRAARMLVESSKATLIFAVAVPGGTMVRLLPQRQGTQVARWTARVLLRVMGKRSELKGEDSIAKNEPAVLVVNRADELDPLVLLACLPTPLRFGDATAFSSLGWPATFLLKPLVAAPLKDVGAPPGGTLRQRIRRTLDEGCSVLALADGRVGTPPLASRFRLEGFQAAAETGCSVIPVAVRCESGHTNRRQTRVTLGCGVQPGGGEITYLRDRVRAAIHELYGKMENDPGA